jgi:glycosyltransferase involved in cell wall biosynthesis
MAGSGVSFDDLTFSRLVPHNLKKYIKVIGPQSNIQLVYDACDCFVLSSETEAFPNVVAEAMLSGLPCIVTDVGDAAEIVGDTGWVVSSNSLDELVDAMGEVLTAMKNSREWIRRKELSRERIEQNYSIQKMQDQFNVVWKMAVGNKLCVE